MSSAIADETDIGSLSVLEKYEHYKTMLDIRVDETAQHFPEWRNMAVTVLEKTRTYCYAQKDLYDTWHCCVVSSNCPEDRRMAEEFVQHLSENDITATLSWDITPGKELTRETQKKLDGSRVVFFLCTPSLMEDNNMASLSVKDQLFQYMETSKHNSGFQDEKLLVPLDVPGIGWPGDSHRMRPFGLNIFKSIVLDDEAQYVREVLRAIPSDIQERVREEQNMNNIFKENILRKKALEKSARKVEKIFWEISNPHSLERITQGFSGTSFMSNSNTSHLSSDIEGAASIGGNFSQNVTIQTSSEINLGPAFHVHISDDAQY